VNADDVKLFETTRICNSFRFLAMFSTDDTSIDLPVYIRALQKFLYYEITTSFNMHVVKLGNSRQYQQTSYTGGDGLKS